MREETAWRAEDEHSTTLGPELNGGDTDARTAFTGPHQSNEAGEPSGNGLPGSTLPVRTAARGNRRPAGRRRSDGGLPPAEEDEGRRRGRLGLPERGCAGPPALHFAR